MKKTIYTLNIGNYEPEIWDICFPYLVKYAYKIGAEICVIKEPKLTLEGQHMAGGFMGLEKFQVYELGKEHKNDWNIFIDPDALVHPDFFDVTAVLTKDVTAAYSVHDFSPVRFKVDEYFLRDGRYFGKGNWFAAFSDWCLDYYHPLEDITLEEAMSNCFPIKDELDSNKPMSGHNMVEDYIVSRNISRYGLKHTLVSELIRRYGRDINYVSTQIMTHNGMQFANAGPVFHVYQQSPEQKVIMMEKQLKAWGLKPLQINVPESVGATS
jgi:hypothetical protein